MFDSDTDAVVAKFIVGDFGIVAIAAPDTVITFVYPVIRDPVIAKGHLHSIGRRIGKIIVRYDVVVAAASSGVHRRLSRPEKETIASMRHGVSVKNILAALFVDQDTGAVLPPVVNAVAVSTDIKV